MDYASILGNVAKHIQLDKRESDYFCSLLNARHVPKNGVILEEGQPCQTINYIHKGVFRSYSFDRQGKESIIMFAIDDWWITDIHGFLMDKPALMNIECIEDSIIFQLKRTDLENLYRTVPKFERFFRILMQNSYIREQLRTRQNLTLDAGERYHSFVSKYPQFMQRIPLKHIASYLGVTPQFLSVVRRRRKS